MRVSGGCWWGFFEIGRFVLGFGERVTCWRRDVWIPEGAARFFGLVIVVVFVVDSTLAVSSCCCCCCCVDRIDEAPSTEPPHDIRVSSRASCVTLGKTDKSNANFTSVDSSSDADTRVGDVDGWGGWANRGLFLETKASICKATNS